MKDDDLLVGFLKVRNEKIRENNIVRVLHNLQEFCSDIYCVDDNSFDGTYEYLLSHLPEDHIIRVPPEKQDFAAELFWKNELLNLIHANGPWKYIYWADADEVLDKEGTENIRDFCRANLTTQYKAWAFHYQQLWLQSRWARIDSMFDDGWFFKLWRYHPDLSFEIVPGTHNRQFPIQIDEFIRTGKVDRAPFEVLHYGNFKTCLKWKCIQYANGLGGVERHMNFEGATYREIPLNKFPSGAEHSVELEPYPVPYTPKFKEKLIKLNNLTNLQKTFCVTISTYNRAATLPRAIESVLNQTYQDFIIVVVDDGSTDNTKEVVGRYMAEDPRVFYDQMLFHSGGVAVNEIACDIAVNTCEYWVRLGSDDWFEPNKLELDFKAFEAGHGALYGPFADFDPLTGQSENIGNTPYPLDKQKECFEAGGFIAGWADFAVKTSVLKEIKKKHGSYVDTRLQNMEDCLQNYRICKVSPWVWRGVYDGELHINPERGLMEEITLNKHKLTPTAYWNKDPNGSSANHTIYAKDRALTTQLIRAEKDV